MSPSAASPAEHLVFVFGTLRRGGSNHHLLEGSELLWEGPTEPVFEMVDLGDYPGAIEGGRTALSGELYAVSDTTLAALDELEGVPDHFQRISLEVGGYRAYMYVIPPATGVGFPRLESGEWDVTRRYRDRG